MRKIEIEMLRALANGEAMHKQNTVVGCEGTVYLHGNHIATVHNGNVTINVSTLRNWPTPTTKSRLHALGVLVYTKNGDTFIDDHSIYGPEYGTRFTMTIPYSWNSYLINVYDVNLKGE